MQKRIFRSKSTTYHLPNANPGFTIVELLIVIVIIGILSTIGLVSYNAVLQNTTKDSLQAGIKNAAKQLVVDQIRSSTGIYPAMLSAANNGTGISFSPSTTVTYKVDNTDTPKTFCLSASQSGQSYYITQEGSPLPGPCPVLYLDAGIGTSYPGTGTAWNDLSGNGSSLTLYNGVGYSRTIGGGTFIFDGVNDYAGFTSAPSITTTGSLSAWAYVNAWGAQYDAIIFKGPGDSWNSIDYGLFRNSTSSTFLGTLNDGTNNLQGTGPKSSTITTGQWYYLVFTWDGSVTKFYTNGVQTDSVNYSHGAGARSGNMNIGASVSGTTYFFNGNISNACIYNRSLSSDEVSNTFKALRGRYGL